MALENGMILLSLTAALTSLLTEGIKKAFNIDGKRISLNLLAAIVSIVTALIVSFGYIILFNIAFTPKAVVYILALCLLSFCSATVTYDKVKETFKQLEIAKRLTGK